MPVIKKYRTITDSDIPSTIARDTETTAAIAAHLGSTNPHPQYYSLSNAFFTAVAFPLASAAGNSIALSWNSVQPGQGIAEFCNFAGLGGGDAFNFFRMSGNSTSPPSISHRVSRIDVAGAYIQTSDKRLKSDFFPAPGLATIMSLVPLRYKHWNCIGFDDITQKLKLGEIYTEKIGFLAQDVQKLLPEAVSIPNSKAELLGIDISVVVACAVKAIQELESQVQELRSQVATLSKK